MPTIDVTEDELKLILGSRARTVANLSNRDDPAAMQLLVEAVNGLTSLAAPLTEAATAVSEAPVTP